VRLLHASFCFYSVLVNRVIGMCSLFCISLFKTFCAVFPPLGSPSQNDLCMLFDCLMPKKQINSSSKLFVEVTAFERDLKVEFWVRLCNQEKP